MNVECACVKGAGLPTPLGLLVFLQNGSERRAICVADVPARCVLAGLAAARVTALAEDAVNIGGVGALESDAQVLEGGACVEASLCHVLKRRKESGVAGASVSKNHSVVS